MGKDRRDETSRLLSLVAHDLRTPLAVISGYAHLLEQDLPRDTQSAIHNYLTTIHAHAAMLEVLIDSVIIVDQARHGSLRLNPVQVALDGFVGDAVAETSSLVNEKHLNLTVDSPHPPCYLLADERLLAIAIYNGLSYAIKSARPRSTIKLAIDPSERFGRLKIHCLGIGDSTAFVPETSYRLPGSDGDDDDLWAAGVDLALLAAGYVTGVHGGRVEVSSGSGGALLLVFYFPVVSE